MSISDPALIEHHRPFRIAIDARSLSGPPCGYTIYLCSILQCLRRADFDLVLFSNADIRAYYDEAAGIETRIFGSVANLRWELVDLAKALKADHFDIYFSGANRGMPVSKRASTRYVLGLLDVIPFIFFRSYFVRRWRIFLRQPSFIAETIAQMVSAVRSDAVLTISRQSVIDIRRIFRRREVESHLIRLKTVETGSVAHMRAQFCYLGGSDFRKKVDILLIAFARFLGRHPGYKLVLVGSNYNAFLPLIEQLRIGDSVVLTGFVDHDTKFRILGESVAMVYPSLYEGYGLAIAEGFQAGIPVIAGRGGSQAEVGGEATRLIDPSNADDIVDAMEEMLEPTVRAKWIARGRAQLERLTDPAIETSIIAYFKRQGEIARKASTRP